MKQYYKILRLQDFATLDQIKRAYRSLALRHHPDRGGDQEKMKEVNEAYHFLMNNKLTYDRKLKGQDINGFTIIVGGWSGTWGTGQTATASWTFAQ